MNRSEKPKTMLEVVLWIWRHLLPREEALFADSFPVARIAKVKQRPLQAAIYAYDCGADELEYHVVVRDLPGGTPVASVYWEDVARVADLLHRSVRVIEKNRKRRRKSH